MISRFVIFGASGDLTARLLLPSLSHLVAGDLVPSDLRIVGVDTREWTTGEFRGRIHDALAEHASDVDPRAREAVVEALDYQRADVASAAEVEAVVGGIDQPLLAYLALPPRLFEPTLLALGGAGLPARSAVAVEKPFGDGVESARRLNALLASELPGVRVFRVDHFATDLLVQNILALRFANRLFEPLWNSHHVERVEISWDETLALEGRAAYYDGAGALRDMLQNHLLQVLCLVAMEPPARIEERQFRDARAAVLGAIPSPGPDQARERSVRARYTAGNVGGREIRAYVDEDGVDPDRGTETFAELTLEVVNWRWSGVPFTLRSGKAMARDEAEVAIHFREVPRPTGRADVEPNVLRIGLMEFYVRSGVNVLAPDRAIVPEEFELCEAPPARPAYANLLLEMLRGDPMLSIRGDEAEEAWRIVEPVLDAWSAGAVPMQQYPAGSAGPRSARSG